MDDQTEREQPRGNTSDHSPSADLVSPQQTPSASHKHENPDSNAPTAVSVARELHFLEKLNIFGQLSLAVVGIIAVCIYGCQLRTMNGQLTQIQADALESSKQFQVQLGHFDAGLGRSDELAKHAGEEAGQTGRLVENAKESLSERQAATNRELRPYVFPSKMEIIGGNLLDKPVTLVATVLNSGKTPAMNIHGCADIVVLGEGNPMTDDFPCPNPKSPLRKGSEASTFVLGAGADDFKISSQVSITPADPKQADFSKSLIRDGHIRVYFYGDVFYSDITNQKHMLRSRFCGRYNAATELLEICEKHNKAD